MSIPTNQLPTPGSAQGPTRRTAALVALSLTVAIVLFTAGFLCGHFGLLARNYTTAETPPRYARQFYVFWEAWWHIERQFYSPTPLDAQGTTYGALHGLVASLNDPYATFVEPPANQLDGNTFQGEFGGIGASIVLTDSQPMAVEVLVDSPASKAGLLAGDRLLAVDGTAIAGLPMDQIVLLIRGRIGTPVRLDVQRAEQHTLSLSMVRQPVELPSLSWQTLLDGVGYIRIRLFSARTGEELAGAIEELRQLRAVGLVLDLRGNGGGMTGGATDVLRALLGQGIAYRELGRDGVEKRHAIPFGAPLADWPLALLVDGGTASAAEMVAGAIRDYERGVLIGQRTYGKGSIQGVYQLSDGSSVHLTTSRWLTASGLPVEAVGLEPDLAVAPTGAAGAEDPALRQAVRYLEQSLGRAFPGSLAPLQTYESGKVTV